jgi:hypothetical protein
MFKLLALLFLQSVLIACTSPIVSISITITVILIIVLRRYPLRRLLIGGAFFATFLGFLLILQSIEHVLFKSPMNPAPMIALTIRGFLSFTLFAVFSTLITRLEFLSILQRLHTPPFVISIIYFICYFLDRLAIHSNGLRKSFIMRTRGCGWLSKSRILLRAVQNFTIFAFIRFRDIPKIMEIRGIAEALPVSEWRKRELAH